MVSTRHAPAWMSSATGAMPFMRARPVANICTDENDAPGVFDGRRGCTRAIAIPCARCHSPRRQRCALRMVMASAISSGEMPPQLQITLATGILISGRMSLCPCAARCRLPGRAAHQEVPIFSELVPQAELDDAWRGQRLGVVAPGVRAAQAKRYVRHRDIVGIEPGRIRYVESLGAELDAVTVLPGHDEPLAKAYVDAEVSIAAQNIALARLPGQGIGETLKSDRRVRKQIRPAAAANRCRVLVRTRFHRAELSRVTFHVPVGRPEASVVRKRWQTAGLTEDAGQLPAADYRVQCLAHATAKLLTPPE